MGPPHRLQASETGGCGKGLSPQQKELGKMVGNVQKARRLVTRTQINRTQDSTQRNSHLDQRKGDRVEEENQKVRSQNPLATAKRGHPNTRTDHRQDFEKGKLGAKISNQKDSIQIH